ncbi:MAG: hypothetical protein J6A01_01635 [Proteobacteria bacterium]|nr:hypothetical protein [Pseudomonadota bacterium]
MKKKLSLILAIGALAFTTSCTEEGADCQQNTCIGNVAHICINGHLSIYKDCTSVNGTCQDNWQDNNACAPIAAVCSDGELQCTNDGIPQKCSGGQWVNQDACGEGTACEAGECKPNTSTGCTNEAKQCSGSGIPQVCKDGEWEDQTACEEGNKCVDGECQPDTDGPCTNDETRCSDSGVPQLCTEGEWVDQTECEEGNKCVEGECQPDTVEPCTDEAKQCSDTGIPQLCVEGEWIDQTACDEGNICDNGDCIPDVCDVNGVKRCSITGEPQTCMDGQWVTNEQLCGTDEECVEGECIAKEIPCENDATRCSDNGTPQKCVDGSWADQDACEDNKECGKDTDGNDGVCLDIINLCEELDANVEGCMVNPNNDQALYVVCGDKEVASRIACKDIVELDGSNLAYTGNVCVDSVDGAGKICGCETDEDCTKGFKCDTEAKSCVVKPECETDNECNEGFECKENKCVEKSASTDIPVDCTDKEDGVYCGSENGTEILYYCAEHAIVTEGEQAKTECTAETPHCIATNDAGVAFGLCAACDPESTENQCGEGKVCNEAFECEEAPVEDPCKDKTSGEVCSGTTDIATCDAEGKTESTRKCGDAETDTGKICKLDEENKPFCGCDADTDCADGQECKDNKCQAKSE